MSFKIVCDVKGCGSSFTPSDNSDPEIAIGETLIHDVELPHGWSRIFRYQELALPQMNHSDRLGVEVLKIQADLLPEEQSNAILDIADNIVKEAKKGKPHTIMVSDVFYVCDCHELPLPKIESP